MANIRIIRYGVLRYERGNRSADFNYERVTPVGNVAIYELRHLKWSDLQPISVDDYKAIKSEVEGYFLSRRLAPEWVVSSSW